MDYKEKAIKCVKNTVLPQQMKEFKESGYNLDEQYRRFGDTENLFSKVIVPGQVYEIGYPKCVCYEVTKGQLNNPAHCECSRQSILYILGRMMPDKEISVEKMHTVLMGASECRFRVTVNPKEEIKNIRRAQCKDISRIAEILIFTKRMNYRRIFHNDLYSFGEMQVVSLARELEENEKLLHNYYVYDDEFVKGLVRIEEDRIVELYVDHFFEGQGIGAQLLEFATWQHADYLWALEKNERAISFYERNGFELTGARQLEEGTTEYLVKMRLV